MTDPHQLFFSPLPGRVPLSLAASENRLEQNSELLLGFDHASTVTEPTNPQLFNGLTSRPSDASCLKRFYKTLIYFLLTKTT